MKKLRIGYFGDGPWSHMSLAKLLSDKDLEVVFVCARNDNPDEILKSMSAKDKIDFFTHPNINSQEFFDLASKYRCDLFVSMSFNQIFRAKIMSIPPLSTINCHAGKLPFYRGRNVLNWVLINDESDFGITVHYVDEGIDTGDIILQRCYTITDEDDYSTLLTRAYAGCSSVLYEAVKLVQKGNPKVIKQKDLDVEGTYCIARRVGDELLYWNQNSREIFNFVRAICQPGPVARTFLGSMEIKINHVQLLPKASKFKGIAGSVIGVEAGSFLVKTLDSFVRVTEWSGYANPRIGDRLQ
jgi:methionyl-tRNA formyltransferase